MMKKAKDCSLWFAAFLIAAIASPLAAQDFTGDMKVFAQKWQDAYNRADKTTLVTMYTDNVTQVNPVDGTTSTITKEDIGSGFERSFSQNDSKIEITVDRAARAADGKVVIFGTFTEVDTNKESKETITVSGAFEHVAVSDAGQWKLCRTQVTLSGK